MTMTRKCCVVVGACYLDTILTVPYYPKEDEKLRASTLTKRRGGNGPNTLEVLQQLLPDVNGGPSIDLALCSVLPAKSSSASEQIRASLGPRVNFSSCIYREDQAEAASSYIIRSTDTGARTIVNHNPLREMTKEEFQAASQIWRTEDAWFHFEGRIPGTTVACIQLLRQRHANVKISVEVEKPGRPGLLELATEANVVFYSQTWAKYSGYQSASQCLQAQAAVAAKSDLLFCTWGANGSAVYERSTGMIHEAPAFQIQGSTPVDSTGAGDAFVAGVLACLLSNEDDNKVKGPTVVPPGRCVSSVIKYANEVAGRKVYQEGFCGIGIAMGKDLNGDHSRPYEQSGNST